MCNLVWRQRRKLGAVWAIASNNELNLNGSDGMPHVMERFQIPAW
jgi:hypothetical protein